MGKYFNECEICHGVIGKGAKRCKKHASLLSGNIRKRLPSDKQILEEVKKSTIGSVANKYGVSYTTIQKILLKYR